jgi:hypothetical protein
MIGIGNKGISDLRLGAKSVSAAYLGVNKVWPRASSAITLLDYIQTDGKCIIDIGMAPPYPYTSVVSFKASNVNTEYYVISSSKIQLMCYPSGSRWQASVWRSQASSNNMSVYRLSGTSAILLHAVVKSTVAGVWYETFEEPKLHGALAAYKNANPSKQISKWYDYTSEGNPTDNILLLRDMPSGSRLYGYMLWRDDTLVFNGVPAKKASEHGIYDVVTGAFFGNAGTGTLTGGNI